MGKSTPTPPPAPDPTTVANAQSAANVASATAQQKLNMINTTGPGGTVDYNADPNAPGGYNQVTTLSGPQQAIYDQGTAAQAGALGIANDQLGRVSTALGQALNPSGVQQQYGNGGAIQTSVGSDGQLQYGFNPGQQVQGQAGYQNINQSVNQNENAVYQQAMSRLAPQQALQNEQSDTALANQGLGVNSTAYQNAKDILGRQQNDATNQAVYSAIGSGQGEQNTLMNQQLNQGTFANQAAAQQYGQNQGQAAFNNAAVGQDFSQNLAAAQFANSAQAQQNQQNQSAATFGNQANAQQFQQNSYAQNQPINQFNSLMSSNQVAGPQGVQYTPSQVGQTDVTGAYALNNAANQANYSNALKNNQSTMGGLFQLGNAALGAAGQAGSIGALFSDARLKEDILRVGRRADGLGVYQFRYVGSLLRQIGVMAQEALQLRPDVVVAHPSGYLMVDYGRL
jgi:hypothetical protein